MEMVADILLVAGAMGAGIYCFVLARRLKNFNDLEKGVGGAVAVLSAQVDELNTTLATAQKMSKGSSDALDDLTARAEAVAGRLELMMASLHDLPAEPTPDGNEAAADPLEAPETPMFKRHPRQEAELET